MRRALESIYRKQAAQLLVRAKKNSTIYRRGEADYTAGEVYAGGSKVDVGQARRLEG